MEAMFGARFPSLGPVTIGSVGRPGQCVMSFTTHKIVLLFFRVFFLEKFNLILLNECALFSPEF